METETDITFDEVQTYAKQRGEEIRQRVEEMENGFGFKPFAGALICEIPIFNPKGEQPNRNLYKFVKLFSTILKDSWETKFQEVSSNRQLASIGKAKENRQKDESVKQRISDEIFLENNVDGWIERIDKWLDEVIKLMSIVDHYEPECNMDLEVLWELRHLYNIFKEAKSMDKELQTK